MHVERPPLAVEVGLLSQRDFAYLDECRRNKDSRTWREYTLKLVKGNIPLWNVFILGYDHTPHMVGVYEEMVKYQKRLVRIPRDHSKSWWALGETVHDVCFSTVPGSGYEDPRILLVQETASIAAKSVLAVRNVIEKGGPNGVINLLFGDLAREASAWKENLLWLGSGDMSKDPTLEAIGVNGAVTGGHPKRVRFDDAVTKKNARTAHMRRLHRDWFFETLDPMFSPGTEVTSYHTPYYVDDMNATMYKSGEYRLIERKALTRKPSKEDFTEVYDSVGVRIGVELTARGMELNALWPCPLGTGNCPNTKQHYEDYGVHRSVEYLLHEKFVKNPSSFSGQFMMDLVNDAETRIKEPMLRFYSFRKELVGEPSDYNEHPVIAFPDASAIVTAVHGWDHAIGKKRQHDRTALARAYRTESNDVFYINKAGRWDFTTVVSMMESNFRTDPILRPKVIATEGLGFQEAYSELLGKTSREILPIETLKNAVDKDTALADSGILQHMMNGKVFIDIEDEETVEELLAFTPEQRSHDDIVDAMRIAFNMVKKYTRPKAGFVKSRHDPARLRWKSGDPKRIGHIQRRR